LANGAFAWPYLLSLNGITAAAAFFAA